ncbi:MAG: universal stress protein [Gammaproteobacteria bacterium]
MREAAEILRAPSRAVVLVPIDFSDCSRAALAYAAQLVDGSRTQLLILHVIHDSASHPGVYRNHHPRHSAVSITDVAGEMVAEMLDEIRSQAPELGALQTARSLLVSGLPGQRIVEVAEKERVAMIVMGTHGRNGIAHMLQGSVAEHVSKYSRVPVTTVKESTATAERLNVDALSNSGISGGI